MSSILWQYDKSFGGLRFGVIIETVNWFTNRGNYAKGSVYLNGGIVDTLWFGSKEDFLERVENIKVVSHFFNMTDPSFLSYDQMQYLLDQDGEFDSFSSFVRFQNTYWLKKFILDDHYISRFSYSGSGFAGTRPERYCDNEGFLGPNLGQDYILNEAEITNNANILKVEYAIFQQNPQVKTFTLSPYFYKCAKVALLLNSLFNIVKYKEYYNIYALPNQAYAQISWEMKQFINDFVLYPTKV